MRQPIPANTCETCIFFYAQTKHPRKNQDVRHGHCHRYPPAVIDSDRRYLPAGFSFPHVHGKLWCGEYVAKQREGQ